MVTAVRKTIARASGLSSMTALTRGPRRSSSSMRARYLLHNDTEVSRPDFIALVYPGPTPFARGGNPPIPRNTPPAFIICGGAGDRVHAMWATEYFTAMLQAGIPNVEMHIYGNGRHPGELLTDGSHMSAGLADRNGMPFGKWQDRYIGWFRDLGFLQKPGVETKAARDIAAFVAQPPRASEGRSSGARKTP